MCAAATWSRIRLGWCMAGSVCSGLVPPPPAVYIRTRIVVLYVHTDFGCRKCTRVLGLL